MLLIAGTVPIEDLPLIWGEVRAEGKSLAVDGHRIPCAQGTAAMVSAALSATDYLGLDRPHVVIAGDSGRGEGSRLIYECLIQRLSELSPSVLALHYCLPDMTLMRRLMEAIDSGRCAARPIMIADAASMYAAKAAGLATSFDVFTPDASEMAFLADPDAIHPAYINRHLFDTDVTRTPELVAAAYRLKNAASVLLVKGALDYVVCDGKVVDTISDPDVPEMEAIGGTGDTVTGLVSAFACAGLELSEAAMFAARANRVAGKFAGATVSTRVGQVIDQFPTVFKEYLCRWSGICCIGGNQDD